MFRKWKSGITSDEKNEFVRLYNEDKKVEAIARYTRRLGQMVGKFYGWC